MYVLQPLQDAIYLTKLEKVIIIILIPYTNIKSHNMSSPRTIYIVLNLSIIHIRIIVDILKP